MLNFIGQLAETWIHIHQRFSLVLVDIDCGKDCRNFVCEIVVYNKMDHKANN